MIWYSLSDERGRRRPRDSRSGDRRYTPAITKSCGHSTRALSSGVFTVAMDVSGLPPFAQRTHKGWRTRSCVNTQLENAVEKCDAERSVRRLCYGWCPILASLLDSRMGLHEVQPVFRESRSS